MRDYYNVNIKDLPDFIQADIELALQNAGLSQFEIGQQMELPVNMLHGVVDEVDLFYIYGLVDDYYNDTDYDLSYEDDELPPLSDVHDTRYGNDLRIDFSPSGARYTLSGTYDGSSFSFGPIIGSGEHTLELIWDALTRLGQEDLDEYSFDNVYIDGNKIDIGQVLDDYYNEDYEQLVIGEAKRQNKVYISHQNLREMPIEIQMISDKWSKLSESYGDSGSCVMGAGFTFSYEGTMYFLPPLSCWQGSLSWEHYIDEVRSELEAIGAKNINYDWGVLD